MHSPPVATVSRLLLLAHCGHELNGTSRCLNRGIALSRERTKRISLQSDPIRVDTPRYPHAMLQRALILPKTPKKRLNPRLSHQQRPKSRLIKHLFHRKDAQIFRQGCLMPELLVIKLWVPVRNYSYEEVF
jgi:hypothetical protein